MTTARQRARQRADMMFDMGMDAGFKAPSNQLIGSIGGTNLSYGSALQAVRTHEDQYKHAKRGWSFASIRPIANRVAAQPLKMARMVNGQSERAFKQWERDKQPAWTKTMYGNLAPVEFHPLLDAVCHPNPLMVQWVLAWMTAASLQATGKAYWWFTQSEGKVQIWPFPAHWVEPDHNGGFRKRWLVTPEGASEPFPIPGEEVAFFYFPDAMNPFGSVSPLAAAGRTILSDDAIHEAQYRGFMHGSMPQVAFVMGEKVGADGVKQRPEITKDQREELSARLRQLYGGPEKHGKFILLDALIADVKKLSHAPTEMDYMNSAKIVEREIQKIFGVNPIIMGEIENANRASATIAGEIFAENVINPMLALLGQVLTEFVNESGLFGKSSAKYIAFYDECTTRDPELEAKNWGFAYDRGIIGDDDYRINVLRIPPKKQNGNVARINAMLVETPVDGSKPAEKPEPIDNEVRQRCKAAFNGVWLKNHGREEKALARTLEGFFRNQAETVARQYAESNGEPVLSFYSDEEWTDSLLRVMRPALKRVMYLGAGLEESYQKSKLAFTKAPEDLFDNTERVQDAIEQYTDQLFKQPYWEKIAFNVRRDIEWIVDSGLRDTQTTREIAARIEAALIEGGESVVDARVRAMRIARTEITGALNAGGYAKRLQLADTGFVTGSIWSTVLDEDTRGADPDDNANHVIMDDVVVPIGMNFILQGEEAPFPGHYSLSAKQRVHCRCSASATTILDEPPESSFEPALALRSPRRIGHCAVHGGM